jgi:hypothetical protein
MGATKTNIVIGILVLIIACLSVSLYRITRLRTVLHEVRDRVPTKVPLDVFVTGMAEAVEMHDRLWLDVAAQNVWLRRHLEQTVSKLETEYQLEPIPTKTAYPKQGTMLSEWIQAPEVFLIPYEKPEFKFPPLDPNECGLLNLKFEIDNQTRFFVMEIHDAEFWIENFYERLQRLEQTLGAANKDNPK